jgi:hypothetical protein
VVVLDVSVGLFNQPFGGIPGPGTPLAGDTLDAARRAHVLHAEANELRGQPDFDVKEAPAAAAAGLGSFGGRRGDHRMLPRLCREPCCGLRPASLIHLNARTSSADRASLAKIIQATRLIAQQDFNDFKPLTPPWCLIRDARWNVEAFKRTMIRDREEP